MGCLIFGLRDFMRSFFWFSDIHYVMLCFLLLRRIVDGNIFDFWGRNCKKNRKINSDLIDDLSDFFDLF